MSPCPRVKRGQPVSEVTCERWVAGKCWQSRSFTAKTKEKGAGWGECGTVVVGVFGWALKKKKPSRLYVQLLRPLWFLDRSVGRTSSPPLWTALVTDTPDSMYWMVGGVCVGLFISSPPVQWESVTRLTLLPVCAFRSRRKFTDGRRFAASLVHLKGRSCCFN